MRKVKNDNGQVPSQEIVETMYSPEQGVIFIKNSVSSSVLCTSL
jgi:hypothetical protein